MKASRPDVIYFRSSDYQEIAPDFDRLVAADSPPDELPPINLADYWDYVEGLTYESYAYAQRGLAPPLRRLSVFLTERCNLRCRYCRQKTDCGRSLDVAWVQRNLAEAASLGVVFFDIMGLGEPTLVPALPQLVATAAEQGIVSTVGTNGATQNLADDAFRNQLLGAGSLKLRVSLDSADPVEHDQQGGQPGIWQRAVALIKQVIRAREDRSVPCSLFINKLVTKHNLQHLLRDLRFFAELGVDDVHLIPVRFDTPSYLSAEMIRRFNAEISPAIDELGARYVLPWLRTNRFPYGETEEEILCSAAGRYYRSELLARECHVQRGQMLLGVDGKPWTCLWARRNGGHPIPGDFNPDATIGEIRARLLMVNYLDVQRSICEGHCARRIVAANNRVACTLGKQKIEATDATE